MPRCKGIKKDGLRCNFNGIYDGFCGHHRSNKIIKKKTKNSIKKEEYKREEYKKNNKKCKIDKHVELEYCNICCDEKNEFKIFKCGHSLCTSCIVKLNSFNCPYCRKNFKDSLHNRHIYIIEKNIIKYKKEKIDEETRNIIISEHTRDILTELRLLRSLVE